MSAMADESETPVESEMYTVHRVQDGMQDRAEMTIGQARAECAMLNAQARIVVGQTSDGAPIYRSKVHGEISRYEIRSASGLVASQ
jgi:hypothetical protein